MNKAAIQVVPRSSEELEAWLSGGADERTQKELVVTPRIPRRPLS